MKRKKRRLVSLIVATTICASMPPTTALAVETEMVEETIESTSVPDELSYIDDDSISVYNDDLAVISENDDIVGSGTCGDNVKWVLYSNGNLIIYGTGAMYNYISWHGNSQKSPWCYYNSDISSVTITDGVTSIGGGAFSGCSNLTNIEIPDSVIRICDYTFEGCKGLTNIEIPDSVTSIGYYAFYNCSSLTSIEIPDSVTSIAQGAFSGCSSMTDVTLSDFMYSIEESVFLGCNSLISVTLPELLRSVGDYAFSGCDKLTSVTLPNSLTSIGNYAFNNCASLTEIIIPNHVKSIGKGAFTNCSGLTRVTCTGLLESIGESAFASCGKLSSVTLPNTLTSIGNYAFSDCGKLTSITLPDSLISIGSYAFEKCVRLNEIVIPDNVKSIGSYAFKDCARLISATLPSNLTVIEEGVFYECSRLTSVYIPSSVTGIRKNAFYDCLNLTDVYYTGSEEEWNAMDINYDGNVYLTYATTHYNWGNSTSCIEHTPGKVVRENEIPATCTATGSYEKVITCTVCGEEISRTVIVTEQVDHTFGEWIVTKEATEMETGIQERTCTVCGYIESEVIPSSVNIVNSGKCGDNVTWVLYDNGTMVISGTGEIYNYKLWHSNPQKSPWCYYNSDIASVTITDGVTSIGGGAFSGCSNLTSIEIPDSVTRIGDYAFEGCRGLTNIEIPDSVTSICYYAFSGCSSLTSIEIPDSVTRMDEGAFSGCSSLTDVTLSDFVYSIENSMFDGCNSLISVTLPELLRSIGDYAFSGCDKLTSVTLPNSLTSIGNYAFNNCASLTEIIIPNHVKSIGKGAFTNCSGLTRVTCTGLLESIGESAFASCGKLSSVTLPNTLTSIGNYAFSDCGKLTSITLPDSLISIGSYAFEKCVRLTEIIIPDNVKNIGSYAFKDCVRLTSTTLPSNLTVIEEGMFYECSRLTIVYIPSSVTSINKNAFYDCLNLTDVYYIGSEEEWNAISIDSEGNEYLAYATIHYAVTPEPLEIITQPNSVSAYENDTVTLTVEATGDNLTYQWYYMKDGDTDYTIWDEMTEPTITFQMSSDFQNMTLHCVVTDGTGDTRTSDDAKLTLLKAIEITSQPEDFTTSAGEKVTLAVVATGDGLTYQWQYKKVNGNWTSWASYKSASMSTKATSAWDGMKIRCIITDAYGNTVTTREVQSSFKSSESVAITITSEPQDITTAIGESVTLSVAAIGDGLTYQWQYKKSGGDWTSWKNYKSDSMTTKATSAWNGMKIRCVITDANGNTVTTREVQSSFKPSESAAITITSEPQDITTAIGESVTLTVVATGNGLTYQWQYKKVGGDWTSWKNYKSDSMTTKASSAWDGMKIRCVITDANGKTVTTREVQSSFQSSEITYIIITSEPQDITTSVGESVTLSVAATGSELTYQWQYKKANGDWTSWKNYKSASMTAKATAAWDGMKIRCIITDANGNTATTREVQCSFQSSVSYDIAVTSLYEVEEALVEEENTNSISDNMTDEEEKEEIFIEENVGDIEENEDAISEEDNINISDEYVEDTLEEEDVIIEENIDIK